MTQNKKKIGIVTGASAGLGKEFALQLDKEFFLDEIWLVARRAQPMRELADSFLKSKGVPLSFDLTIKGDVLALLKKVQDEDADIQVLVNNAGYGKIGPFESLGIEEQLQMIDLNVRSLTHLTHACLPHMPSGSYIVEVASSIAFTPAPYFAVYAATKSFVLSLAEALNFELKDKGIHVIAVCPGPVNTEFFQVAQKNEYMKDKVGRAEPFNKALMANAQEVVAKAIQDMKRKKSRSIFGMPIQLFATMAPFLPNNLLMKLMAKRKDL